MNPWHLAAPLVLCGFGLGAGISPMFQTVLATVPPRDAGSGSGALQSFQQMGSAVGIAITGQIFFSSLTVRFAEGSMQHPAFVASLERALVYEVLAFLAVAGLVIFLKNPTAGTPGASLRAAPAGAGRRGNLEGPSCCLSTCAWRNPRSRESGFSPKTSLPKAR